MSILRTIEQWHFSEFIKTFKLNFNVTFLWSRVCSCAFSRGSYKLRTLHPLICPDSLADESQPLKFTISVILQAKPRKLIASWKNSLQDTVNVIPNKSFSHQLTPPTFWPFRSSCWPLTFIPVRSRKRWPKKSLLRIIVGSMIRRIFRMIICQRFTKRLLQVRSKLKLRRQLLLKQLLPQMQRKGNLISVHNNSLMRSSKIDKKLSDSVLLYEKIW